MTQEEKAKRYDEAIKIVNEYYDSPRTCIDIDVLLKLFPELKESEDERIRKVLVEFFKSYKEQGTCGAETFNGIPTDNIIAWLEKQGDKTVNIDIESIVSLYKQRLKNQGVIENSLLVNMCLTSFRRGVEIVLEKLNLKKLKKQGEQTSDKIEPKFKVGDWVVLSTSDGEKVVQIDSIEYFKSGEPRYITSEGRWFGIGTKAHLFTIADAKDGDVLATEPIEGFYSPFVAIYKKQNEEDFDSYCFIGFDGKFYKGENGHSTEEAHPATKEQRDLLFQKMKEASYEWDAEKKELKKVEQKPAWSEEDEEMLDSIIEEVCYPGDFPDYPTKEENELYDECLAKVEWLKSLRHQNTWKPSDEQMEALDSATENCAYSEYQDCLRELIKQLKKLREE